MGDQVVTELTIDADTSGVDSYVQSMQSAEAATQKVMSSGSDLALSLAGIGAGMGAVIVAVASGIDYIVGLNKQLADLQTVAKQTGLSLADLQGIQFGGQLAGLSTDQINAGLEKSASLLNDASRNANSLSKELDANGISVKNANGDLISENQLLGIAAQLIANAKNPGDALAIAQMLGFTKDWIPLLEQGAGAMSELTDQAKAAGAVIDDETIQRATEFDDKWRASSVAFSSYMKSAMLEVLPYLDDLIDGAAKFIKSISVQDIQNASAASFKQFNDATGIPDSAVIDVNKDIGANLSSALTEWLAASPFQPETWANLGRVFSDNIHIMTPQQAEATIPGYAASQFPVSQDSLNSGAYPQSGPADFNAIQKAMDAADDAAGDLADGFSKVADRASNANDILDRAINTLQKHTDQTYADADAVGLGAGALAGARAEAALYSAAAANLTTVTPTLAAQFKDMGDDAADAANDLAKLQVAASIKFQTQTIGLSPQDLQIATQLKSIYPDVNVALGSVEAAQLRVLAAQKQLNDATTQFGTNLLSGLLRGEDAMKALTSAASTLISTLASNTLKQALSSNGSLFGSQNLASGQGALTVGAAGLAGYSSANPFVGALGGALAGAAFGPAGAAIGGLAGAIGGLIGQSNAAEQAMQQAQAQWAAMAGQVVNFDLAAKGFNLGPLTQELQKRPIANDNPEKGKKKPNDRDEHNPAQGQSRAA